MWPMPIHQELPRTAMLFSQRAYVCAVHTRVRAGARVDPGWQWMSGPGSHPPSRSAFPKGPNALFWIPKISSVWKSRK